MEPIVPIAPEVSIDLPPPPDALGPLGSMVGGLAVLLIITVLLRRMLRGRRGAETLFAFSVGLGNALMEIGALLQPDRPQVTVSSEKNDLAQEHGENGDDVPPDRAHGPPIASSAHRSPGAEPGPANGPSNAGGPPQRA